MDFQKSSKLRMNSQWTEPKDFSTTQLLNLGLKSYIWKGRAENNEIPKSSFSFQQQTNTVKRLYQLDEIVECCTHLCSVGCGVLQAEAEVHVLIVVMLFCKVVVTPHIASEYVNSFTPESNDMIVNHVVPWPPWT